MRALAVAALLTHMVYSEMMGRCHDSFTGALKRGEKGMAVGAVESDDGALSQRGIYLYITHDCSGE